MIECLIVLNKSSLGELNIDWECFNAWLFLVGIHSLNSTLADNDLMHDRY